jgi:hypothetical protein
MIPGPCALHVPSGTQRDGTHQSPTARGAVDLRTWMLAVVLGYSAVYAVLAVVLIVRPRPELNTGVIWSLPLLWIAWQTSVAVGHIRAVFANWRVRRRHDDQLADLYYPGARPHPAANRAT